MSNDNHSGVVWQLPQHKPVIKEGQVHIWRANLNLSSPEIQSLKQLLSPNEIARADRFRFPLHKKRFIVARGILRQLLGSYLNISPDSLIFQYGDRGKPLLTESSGNNSLQFNISHSQEYALYGFIYHQPIGVDLEYVREMPDALKIAQRFFSANEYNSIQAIAPEKQQQAFFQLWTAKEAYLKAIGTGLSGSLASVDIAIALSQVQFPHLLSIAGDHTQVINWSLYGCIPQPDYVAAIAFKASIPFEEINFWHWQ